MLNNIDKHISHPLFSVIIPTYNRADLVARTVQSVLNQSFVNFEVIVVDDGSTDNTANIIKCINDVRISYIFQENQGVSAARNLGVSVSKGKYIIFLDSDDEALPNWLERFANAFVQTTVGIVCCGVIQCEKIRGANKESTRLPQNGGPLYENQPVLFLAGAFAVQRQLLEEVGGYKAGCAVGENNELAFRLIPLCLAKGLKISNIAEPLVKIYRATANRSSQNPSTRLSAIREWQRDYGMMFQQKSPRAYASYCSVGGVAAFQLGYYIESQNFFWQAIRVYPWDWRLYVRLCFASTPFLGQKLWLKQSNE